ncbi:MAG: hypothetical protein JAZ02_08220 [Candidatus Thiodiazotropha endolucinida]|nr:hypothetical protein [Candidatus Thiodiazotropha endolucinida]
MADHRGSYSINREVIRLIDKEVKPHSTNAREGQVGPRRTHPHRENRRCLDQAALGRLGVVSHDRTARAGLDGQGHQLDQKH